MGCKDYEDLVRDFRIPIVVGGFEPVDILEAILMLVRQLEAGEARLGNEYVRSVSYQGTSRHSRSWPRCLKSLTRNGAGIGPIPQSGLRLREEYAAFDANRVFDLGEIHGGRARRVHQRPGFAGIEEADGLSSVWHEMHAGKSIGSAHGFE